MKPFRYGKRSVLPDGNERTLLTQRGLSPQGLEYAPFDTIGGPFRFRKLFGDRAEAILDDLNAALAA